MARRFLMMGLSVSGDEAMTPGLQRKRAILIILTVAIVVWIVYMARGALFPFILSAVLAYLIYPLVSVVERLSPWRKHWPGFTRISAILLVYLGFVAAVGGVLTVIIPPAIRQATELIESIPEIYRAIQTTIEDWNQTYSRVVPEGIRMQLEDALQNASTAVVGYVQRILTRTISGIFSALSIVIGLAIVPFLVYYYIKDRESLLEHFYSWFPKPAQQHVRNVLAIINRILGSYVRAQLTLALAVGTLVSVGLFFLGVQYWVFLGIFAGITELVPVIGPWLGAVPGIIVALATSPRDAIWVALLYFGVQMLENTFLVPRVQGLVLKIHPALVIVILVLGSEIAGIWGVLLGVPLTAAAIAVFKYFNGYWTPPEVAAQAEYAESRPAAQEPVQARTDGRPELPH